MPRNGSGVYSRAPGTTAVPQTTIQSSQFNGAVDDLAADNNVARPIVAGGTGATTATAARANLGLTIGTDVQAFDPGLASIAGLTTAANQLLYTTASDTYAVTVLTAAGRALLDDADAGEQRNTLGLGSAATLTADNATIGAVPVLVDDGTGTAVLAAATVKTKAIQTARYTSNATISAVTPHDGTIPQNTEGAEILAATITPSSTAAKIRVRVTIPQFYSAAGNSYATIAVFTGSASAIFAAVKLLENNATNESGMMIEFIDSPATTSAINYTVRIGVNANSVQLNRNYGAASFCELALEEVN